VLYAADGLSDVEIAARLDSNPEVVGRWRSRFQRERLTGLEDERGRVARAVSPAARRRGQGDRLSAAAELGVPLSRFSRSELHRLVIERGVGADDRALAV
jgi:transposase-like protein